MNMEVERALSNGVIKQTPSGHRCLVCEKDVTEIQPHLRGRDHFNNLAWEALSNSSPSPYLPLDAIPPVVREANERRELELVNKARFSYRCLVCPKKPLSDGIRSLETHLKGKEHNKAKKIQASSVVSSPPDMLLSATSHWSPQNIRPQLPPQVPEPQSYPYPPGQPSPYQPPRSSSNDSFTPRYPSGNLQQPLQCPSGDPQQLQQQTAHPSRQSVRDMYSSPQTPYTHSIPLAAAPGLDQELQHALREGVVMGSDANGFTCRPCDKFFNGHGPCLQHLNSIKHTKKVQMWTPPALPDIGRLSISMHQQQQRMAPTYDSQPIPARPAQQQISMHQQQQRMAPTYDSQPIPTRPAQQQIPGTLELRWRIETGPVMLPSDTVYRNTSLPRGLVLVFNYIGQGEHIRHGAEWDSLNLKTLFHLMGYHVFLYENQTKAQTVRALEHAQDQLLFRNYDSFIVFILSHGKEDQTFCTSSMADRDCMQLDEVRYMFTDVKCPALKDKPKLFFVNFCRGSNRDPRTAYDSVPLQRDEPRNMLTVYSCINSFVTPRNPDSGTFFVQAWCEVLASHAYREEMRDLHQRASLRLHDMRGSTMELQDYAFKKFYFNPVETQ